MRSLSTILSDDGERALETLKSEVQSFAAAEDFVTSIAIRLAQKDDAEVEAELQKGSRELVDLVSRNAPTLPGHVVNGLVIGFCELVIARRWEIIAHPGGHA
jgi:hypothetical protein